jgi:hypothetical protein
MLWHAFLMYAACTSMGSHAAQGRPSQTQIGQIHIYIRWSPGCSLRCVAPTHRICIRQHRRLGVRLLTELLDHDQQHSTQLALHLGLLLPGLTAGGGQLKGLADLRQDDLQRTCRSPSRVTFKVSSTHFVL